MDTKALDSLIFDDSFTRELPADLNPRNDRRQVTRACYSPVVPTTVSAPTLVAYSHEMAGQIGLDRDACESDPFLQVFSGNRLLPGMRPYAACYGGHQFGNWAGQLGDGRVINLGEIVNQGGERLTLQLKGAGPTPYSRTADGLAVLRSSVREFLCSEAMHHLGVPTTRALSLVLTGEKVTRDMFYDGHPQMEPGAIVCRVAPSFLRFGNFQIHAMRGENDLVKALADYTLRHHFRHFGEPSKAVYIAWFQEVCATTATMIVEWMRVGFVHGVMNTDNMSILGLTMDYGPYGWLENYDPHWTPNTTDATGRRYRFGHQHKIALWNLYQLANAIVPLIGETEPLEQALDAYPEIYTQQWQAMMGKKLGLGTVEPEKDDALITELLALLESVETDMTLFYRRLADLPISLAPHKDGDNDLSSGFIDAYYKPEQLTSEYKARFGAWIRSYKSRVGQENIPDDLRRHRMNAVNPKYTLRNYLAQQAIDKVEQGDHAMVAELLELLRRPYDEQPDKEAYAGKRPDWARHRAGCSMLSCSS
jgi:uncharacterized protein YdiU (UPF0061 family)